MKKFFLFIFFLFCFLIFKTRVYAYSSSPNPSFDGYVTNLGESNYHYFYNDTDLLWNGNIKYIHDYIYSQYINKDSINVNGNLMDFNYYVLGEFRYCLRRSSTTNSDGGNCYSDGYNASTDRIYYLFLFESKPDLRYYSYYYPTGNYHNLNRITFNSVYDNLCFTTLSPNDSTNDNINFSSLTCGSSSELSALSNLLSDRNLFYSGYSNGSMTPFYYNVVNNLNYYYSSNKSSNNFWFLTDKNFDIPYTLASGNGVKNYQPRLCSDRGLCNTDSSVQYYVDVGENVQSAFEMFDISPSISLSTIDLTDSNNNVVGKDVYINWYIKDNNKYLYQYKLSTSDDWVSFNTNLRVDVLHVFENGTYNFQIVDKSTNDVISRSNLTITGIYNSSPVINLIHSYNCFVNYKGGYYYPCESYKVDVENFDSVNSLIQYKLSISDDWIDINNLDVVSLYENGTYNFRVINVHHDDVVLSEKNIDVVGITKPNTNEPYISSSRSCDETIFVRVFYDVFNVDNNLTYKYGISSSPGVVDISSNVPNVEYDSTNRRSHFYIRNSLNMNYIVINIYNGSTLILSNTTDLSDMFCVNGNVVQGESVGNTIDDSIDFVKDSNYSSFIASILRITYDNIPPLVLDFIVKFLLITIVGVILVVIGWK